MTEYAGRTALRKIVEGLDGVTPGPYFTLESPWGNGEQIVAGSDDGNVCRHVADTDPFSTRGEYEKPYPEGDARKDAAHFARCDPATIRSIASYVEGLEAERTRMRDALKDAHAQIGYLHDKFEKTGSGNAVIARITAALTGRPNDEKGRT